MRRAMMAMLRDASLVCLLRCAPVLTSVDMALPPWIRRLPSSFTPLDLLSCLSICRWFSLCFFISCSKSAPSTLNASHRTRDSISLSQALGGTITVSLILVRIILDYFRPFPVMHSIYPSLYIIPPKRLVRFERQPT